MESTHGDRVCTYRVDNGRFTDKKVKEAVQTWGQQISYSRVGSHHRNATVETRIKELTLGSWTLHLHTTRLRLEYLSTMLWTLSFKADYQRYDLRSTINVHFFSEFTGNARPQNPENHIQSKRT